MINKHQRIRMTATEYVSQFHGGASKYYRADFYVSTVLVEKMLLNKYAVKDYQGMVNAFKVELC
jgi:hypothetical protein